MSEARKGEIVPFGEQKLLVYGPDVIDPVASIDLREPAEVYLAGNVFQGEYGPASFALVVPHPQPRPFYYTASEGTSGTWDDNSNQEIEEAFARDPLHASHFYNTNKGFAVVRTVVAPVRVWDRLKTDRFLGPAVINKCFLEGTVPDNFDEEESLDLKSSLGDEKYERVDALYEQILGNIAAAGGEEFTYLRTHASWHSYRLYETVVGQVQEACRITVANFDEILGLFAKDLTKLHDFGKGIDYIPRIGPASPSELPE